MDEIQALHALPKLADVVKKHNLWAQKSLGQNFLFDLNITDKIVRSAGNLIGKHVIEIGPGPGGLTRPILWHQPETLTVVEYDERAIPILQDLKKIVGNRLTILQEDALHMDVSALIPAGSKAKIIANLPYNIGTPLLIHWLKHIHLFESITVMLQKEVVQRICAQPGSADYGRLSIMAQWLCHANMMFDVPPSAFIPAPKVTSSVVHLAPRATPLGESTFDAMEKTCALLFQQRRKMLRAILKPHMDETALGNMGINPTSRPENLTIQQVVALANLLANKPINE